MAVARRLKAIVRVNEEEVVLSAVVFHPDEPFVACLPPLSERPMERDDLVREDGSWEVLDASNARTFL